MTKTCKTCDDRDVSRHTKPDVLENCYAGVTYGPVRIFYVSRLASKRQPVSELDRKLAHC